MNAIEPVNISSPWCVHALVITLFIFWKIFFLIFKSPISLKLCMWAPFGEAAFTWAVPPVFLVLLQCSDGLKVPFSPNLHQTPFRKTAGPFFVHGQNVRKLCVCVCWGKGQLFGGWSLSQLFVFGHRFNCFCFFVISSQKTTVK